MRRIGDEIFMRGMRDDDSMSARLLVCRHRSDRAIECMPRQLNEGWIGSTSDV
jgi:hypothetical protein